MPNGRRSGGDDERVTRIDMLLEELRLNTEDLRELARQAKVRARETRASNRAKLKIIREAHDKRRGR